MRAATAWLHSSITTYIGSVLKSAEAKPHLAIAWFGGHGGNRRHQTQRTNRGNGLTVIDHFWSPSSVGGTLEWMK